MPCKAGTISQIHQRLIADGYLISQYALRKWVRDGTIPSVHSGNKIFIVYSHVVEFLTTGSVVLEPVASLV